MEITFVSVLLFEMMLLSLIFWYIVFHLRRRRFYKLAAEFQGPPALPIIGNALKFKIPINEMPDAMLEGLKYYKSPTRLWFGSHLVLCLWNPEDIKIVLNSPYALSKQPFMYKMIELMLGRGLITIPAKEWKRHRKLISPNFNQVNIKSFFDVFDHHAKMLVINVKHEENKEIFDVQHYLQQCALDTVMESLLGLKLDANSFYNTQDIAKWFHRMLNAAMSRASNLLYSSDFIFKMSSDGRNMTTAKGEHTKIIHSIIEHWKQASLRNQEKNGRTYTEEELTKPKNFVEHLLSTSDELGKLTEEELQEEVNTIIMVGLDTTASIMGFLLIILGMHSEVQQRLYEEITHVLGARKDIEYEDLKSCLYLERVIKETLRIFPVLAGIARYTEQDIELEKHIVPAGTSLIIGLLNLHRNPDIWPNPNIFDPDRFLPEEESKRHPYSWIPFSSGPRNCVGHRFALMDLKIMTIRMVQTYKIETSYKCIEDVRLTMLLLLKPTNGYKIRITAR